MEMIQKIVALEAQHYSDSLAAMPKLITLADSLCDLYNTLSSHSSGASLKLRYHVMARAHLFQDAQYRLVTGVAAILRGHTHDYCWATRRAIEDAAFAYLIKKQPEKAAIWRKSNSSDQAYKVYREAFSPKHLFLIRDPLVFQLRAPYEYFSRMSHPSFIAASPSFKINRSEKGGVVNFPYFHGRQDDPVTRQMALMHLISNHFVMFHVFMVSLSELVVAGGKMWELHWNSFEAAFDLHLKEWKNKIVWSRLARGAFSPFPADVLQRLRR